MRPPIPLPALLVALLLLALSAAPAGANDADNTIIQDCQTSATGALTGSYTKAQLKHARRNLPGDVAEYSGCYDAIQQALLPSDGGGSGGNGTGGGDGGSGLGGIGGSAEGGTSAGGGAGSTAPPGPPHVGTEAPVKLATGAPVEPGQLPSIGQDAHELPQPLIVLLALLGLAALVPAALTIGRRVVARRGA